MVLASRAVVLCALVLLTSAVPASAATWRQVTGFGEADSSLLDASVARSGNGVLNILWSQDARVLNTTVSANGKVISGPHTVFVYQQLATKAPMLLAAPDGSLRAFFTGLHAGQAPYDSMVGTATSTDGVAWTVQPTAASDSTPEGSVAKGDLGGTIFKNGTPMSIWGDQYRGYHVGLSDQTPDVNFGSDQTATVSGPNAATDSDSGQVAIGWDDLNTGRTQVAIVQQTANPWFPPGPNIDTPGGQAPELQGRLAMTGRSGGAAGIFVAYLRGTNVFSSRPSVWRIDANGDDPPNSKPIELTKRDGRFVNVAMSVDGRIWGFWAEGLTTGQKRRIFARRSNKNATSFGETVVVKPPQGTDAGNIETLEGEGTASGGALDLVALVKKGVTGDNIANYVTRVLPGITLRAKKLENGDVRFTTLDADDKLNTKIKFAGETRSTGNDGKVTFPPPDPGKYTARATRNGYTPAKKVVRVKAIEDPDI